MIGNTSTPDLDTGWANWFEDYPHPNDFFQPLLDGTSIYPTGNTNLAQFDDPALNREDRGAAASSSSPLRSRSSTRSSTRPSWSRRRWAPFGARGLSTFVSSDIDLDKVIFNPTFSHDLTSFQFK